MEVSVCNSRVGGSETPAGEEQGGKMPGAAGHRCEAGALETGSSRNVL